ncbi:MAG: hypothetical protein ACRD4J_11530 [Nitrososphaeraceae archaeon]
MTQEIILLPQISQAQLLASKRNIAKNYIDKLRLVIKFANYCQKCSNFERVDDLTIDHTSPRFLCHATQYNSDINKQLLYEACHKQKSKYESNFMSRMTRRVIEEIHHRSNMVIDFTDIVTENR